MIDQSLALLFNSGLWFNTRSIFLKNSFKFEIFFLKYFESKHNPCSNPKRGVFNLNFCWCDNTQFLRRTRRDPNLVPLKKSLKSHRQKLRSNVSLFGLFWRCVFDATEVKRTVLMSKSVCYSTTYLPIYLQREVAEFSYLPG